MTVILKHGPVSSAAHKAEMAKIGREVNAQAGITGEPTMTAQQLRALQRAQGVRAADNIGSRELLRMRYGDDYNPDTDEG